MFNYVEGVRFTARFAELIDNPNQQTVGVIPKIRKGFFNTPGMSFSGELKSTVADITFSSEGGYKGQGGYHVYFNPNW